MTTGSDTTRRFSAGRLDHLDEPVRRYVSHAIPDGAVLHGGVRVTMSGRIKIGLWLPFTAVQMVDGRSFTWRALVGHGRLTPLRVTDRSAATRAAIESVVFAPASVLPDSGVAWRAESENVIVARFDLPPEHPQVRVRIDEDGAIRTVSAERCPVLQGPHRGHLPAWLA